LILRFPGGWKTLAGLSGVAALGAFLLSSDWPKYRRLMDHGAGVDGRVTGKGLVGGRKVHYSFLVGGRLYSGTGRAGYGNPEYDQLSEDDEVIVFYLPKNPDVSCLGDPKEHIRDQNRVMSLALLVFTPVLLLALGRELRRAS
jgi:hypothetical protein